MNITEEQKKLQEKAASLVEKTRAGEALTDEERAELSDLKAKSLDLKKIIDDANDAESLLAGLGEPISAAERKSAQDQIKRNLTIGEHFVTGMKANGTLARIKGGMRVAQTDLPEFLGGSKAAGDVHLFPNMTEGTPHLIEPDIDRNIVKQYVQRPTIAGWLGAGNIASNAITYFVEKVWDTEANGDFQTVAENAKKPGMTAPNYTEVTETLKKIAGWIKLSMEMAEDASFLVSEINNRLMLQLTLFEEQQLLFGDGKGTNVLGLMNRSGLQTKTSASVAENMDSIYKAINAVYLKTGFRADGIVINPADYEALRLLKDSNGQYFAGGPFAGQYNVGGILQDPPIWGLQTIQTTAIPAGTVLVGAGNQGATVYRKGGIRVETSNVDGEDFTHNRFTVLAEERIALAVRRPDAFVKLTLANAAA